MTGIADRITAVIAEHTWWLAGNLGIPGMPDWTTYKCNCGWNGDEPHAHVAAVVVAELQLHEETQFRHAFGQGDAIERRWVTGWEKAE